MKLYREVKASERLPEGDCFIVPECVIMADNGKEYYKGAKDFETLTTWLEPVEITEEELYNTINGLIWLSDGGKIQGVPDIVAAILSKLKGE